MTKEQKRNAVIFLLLCLALLLIGLIFGCQSNTPQVGNQKGNNYFTDGISGWQAFGIIAGGVILVISIALFLMWALPIASKKFKLLERLK